MKKLIKSSVFACIATMLNVSALAQVGNEWIVGGQHFFKIRIGKEGIYRIAYTELLAAGVPTAADPKTFRIYHRGVEQAIHAEGENDGNLDPGDFIEFYGRPNDGSSDTPLYTDASAQPHTLRNLYSDTTTYFLTLGSGPGKRMTVAGHANPGLTAETFHLDEKLMVMTESYSPGANYGDLLLSAFDNGEGFTGKQTLQNQTTNYTVTGIAQAVTGGGTPKLEMLLTGRGAMSHAVEVYASSRLLGTVNFSGYQSVLYAADLQWTDISGDGSVTIGIKVLGVNGMPDRASVGYIDIKYPQSLDLGSATEKTFLIPANPAGQAYVEIQNPGTGTLLYDVTDPNNVLRITTELTTTLNAVLTAAEPRKVLATSVTTNVPLKPVVFRQIDPGVHDYIIITHASLRKPASGYTDPVKAFAEYRALPAGGGYDTLIVTIDQLYDQFNYGEQSPMAVFRFMKFLSLSHLPDYLFLIGKGLDVDYGYYRKPGDFPVYKDLVPTAGFPASDMLFTAGLAGTPGAPGVATGRLSASGPHDVAAYLNKVKEFEARPFDDLRRKNILHLSGGIFEGEPQLFRSYLAEFATVAESRYLGGNVTAIAKQSTDIAVINVADEVNQGLSLVTFFGHSAPSTTDFDIGNVTDPVLGYQNKGKYPVLLMNGCSSGSFFLNTSIFGENWTNTPDRGAIGMIAHSSLGLPPALRNYTSLFYNVAFADPVFLGKGIGDVQREVARRYFTVHGTSVLTTTQTQQMVLLGDPALKLFGAAMPDYEVNPNNVALRSRNGDPVTAATDTLSLDIVIRNFGRAQGDVLKVEVQRTLDDHSTIIYDSVFNDVLYSDTITFLIPAVTNGYGNNTFVIILDPANDTGELREDNNLASADFFIPVSGTTNLFPQNFAIVNSTVLDLSFQHTDPLSGHGFFMLELDSTDTFDSPGRQHFNLQGDVLIAQRIEIPDKDSTTYYWRTKYIDPDDDSVIWNISSFTYIENSLAGWGQVDFPQFGFNKYQGLVADPMLERFSFEETVTDVSIRTFGPLSGKPIDSVSFRINGAEYNIRTEAGCRDNTINLVAFNKTTTQPYPGIYLTWVDIQQIHNGKKLICGREPYAINSFHADELVAGNDADLIAYINNIPPGDSVVLFNIGDAGYENWPAAAKTKLEELGISVTQIESMASGAPVAIFGRKGAPPGTAKVHTTLDVPANSGAVVVKAAVTGRIPSGQMESKIIGPASEWYAFIVDVRETEFQDSVFFDVIGITPGGQEIILKQDLGLSADLRDIDAEAYPFLRVVFKAGDPVFVTAPQLKKWFVFFEPVPEGVLLYDGPQALQTVLEGETWSGHFRFVNVSGQDFPDSLAVKFRVTNVETFVTTEAWMNIPSPAPADTTAFTVPFPSLHQEGINHVEVFVNPRLVSEQDYRNNVLLLHDHLLVEADELPPVLDVTIDGRHLQNGDFVSASPHINIILWDNNEFLLTTDTTAVALFLAYPCEDEACAYQPVYFTDDALAWSPETAESEFSVSYRPVNLPEGSYRLRVQARDATGNPSGPEPYVVSFTVSHDPFLSVSGPYPNPFQYKTNFDVVMSGPSPVLLSLEILSIQGRKVYSALIAAEQLYIGTNRITWSGVDDRENKLPPGIYFYRISSEGNAATQISAGKLILSR